MEINILFFGELAAIVGAEKIVLQNIEDTVSLNDHITEKYTGLKNKTYRIAVNCELVSGKHNLKNGDEIALLPPFAGG
jgi:molybdopterin converting factor small subunit